MQINEFRLFIILIVNFKTNENKYQALLADHQADGRGPPVVRGPQVENRWTIVHLVYEYLAVFKKKTYLWITYSLNTTRCSPFASLTNSTNM